MELDLNELEKQEGQSPFVSKFQSFFETQYQKAVERLAMEWPQKRSLFVNFSDLEHYDFELADQLLESPDVLNEAAEMAVQNIHVTVLETKEFKPHVRFYNLPKDRMPLLRNISSDHLGKLVAVEGVVRQLTDVLPKLKVAAWQCRRCGNVYKREQENDRISMPPMCECKHRDFDLLQEESTFTDNQKIQIQEPLEMLKGSEQATILDVIVSDDLVNRVMPGDRTRIVGIIRLRTPKEKNLVYGRFLEAVHLEETAKEFDEVEIAPEEKKEIETLSKNPKIYELLGKSIAPNIYGHEMVKEAIALQLFGGVKKILPNDTNIRGNIHVLLVGDPGVAKSAILQAVNKIAPKSIYTAGKTSTGVGLCVAPDTLILNDSGMKPIQEFVETNFVDSSSLEELPGAFSSDFRGSAFALSSNFDFVSAPIEKIWRIKAPPKMVKIKTRMGRELSLTPATSLTRIKDGKIQWVSAEELEPGDFVACARELPEGREQKVFTFKALLNDKNIKVGDPLAGWIKEITDRLIPKYGSLQNIAKAIGKSRDTLYAVRNPRFYHGWELVKVVKLAREAGFTDEDISQYIKTLFIRHGKNFRIPQYLDDERLAYLVGLALGDGNRWEGKNSGFFRIVSSDASILQDASQIVQNLFGLEAEHFDDGERVPGIRVKFKAICQLLQQFGLATEKQKIALSHLATEMPNSVLASLLQGLFDTDGYVSNVKKGSSHVGISTISPQLAKTLHLALLKFGITAKSRLRARAGKTAVGRTISVTSRNDQSYIEIRGKHNLELFESRIGFRLPRKQAALQKIIESISVGNTNVDVVPEIQPHLQQTGVDWMYKKGKRGMSRMALQRLALNQPEGAFLKRLASANVFWDQIKAKEYFEPAYKHVYDFTVKEHHNFIANGFFVHNTASAVKDDFGEGGWTLKAGALVLANGGLAMSDEFDKMETEDRSAMHEAMEQGMISVAKAGIVTRFKTDTTILAAANPKFARFDQYKNFLEQIDLPPTLISRFDLFFMIFDVLDRKKDEDIAQHILKTHQAGEMTLQRRARGMGKQKELTEFEESMSPAIAGDLLKKYIAFARQNIFPVLTKEAIQMISDYYVDLREQGKKQGTYTATHRQLEGLVRLSEASARVRLSNTVEKEDTDRAIRLLRTSLQELVTDKETGKLDIDMLTSGQSTSQINQLKGVLGIVQRLNQEHDKVLLEQVFDEAQKLGIDREKTREIISKLKRQGDLYEPSLGIIKPVPKEF